MPPRDPPMTEGTVKVMFTQIQKDLDEIKSNHRDDHQNLHERCNDIEGCINQEIKPDLHLVKADGDWLKSGFWFIAGVGSSALLLVIGVIIRIAIGGL